MNQEIDITRIPGHIAIIMDGNGRWAQQKGWDRTLGHKAGVETVKKITEECVRLGVKQLTLYTFSTENWSRPAYEIEALMALVITSLQDEILMKNDVRFNAIGDLDRLPQAVKSKILETVEVTKNNQKMTMTVALSYSSRWEITEAFKQIIKDKEQGVISPAQEITSELINSYLQTKDMPEPDLMIRTGGEIRISNFMLWQAAYTELYFCDTYWPDFGKEDLVKAIAEYQKRKRRFGKTDSQIEQEKTT